MFRPLRRTKRAISEEAGKELLKNEKRGIFAVNGDDGYPYAVPVNYYYDEEANRIYFHGSLMGHKNDAVKKDNKVCFTVFGNSHYKEGDWAPYTQSVVIFGRCNLISDMAIVEPKVRELARKYYPTEEEIEEEIKADIKAVQLYEIEVEHMCAKQVQEK